MGIAPIFNGQNVPQEQTLFEKFHGMIQRAFGLSQPDIIDNSSIDVEKAIVGTESSQLPPKPLGATYGENDKPRENFQNEEEGIILMERAVIGSEDAYNDGNEKWRHEQFFSLKTDDNFGLYADGIVRADDPKNRSKYIQKDQRVFKKKYIDMARAELEQDEEYQSLITEAMTNYASIGEDMSLEAIS